MYREHVTALQQNMAKADMEAALISDPDSIYYFTGYAGYLGMEFGRPTLLFVPADGNCVLVTPLMESEMCRNMTWVDDIRPWEDGVDDEWRQSLRQLIPARCRLGLDAAIAPPQVTGFIGDQLDIEMLDVITLTRALRMIKSAAETDVMRQAGQVAIAMVEAARDTIAVGVPEYEVALAVIKGGTRRAAELIGDDDTQRFFSPTIYNLQVLQSGHDTCMVHRRSSVRRIAPGDPVYLCFCGIANFKHYKLGFDREFFVNSVGDQLAQAHDVTLRAQRAALDAIRPGVVAEAVHLAADAVYKEAGFAPSYRTGRSIGCSFLESPELKLGDRTVLETGMTFAVDGGITVPGQYGTRVGDSIVVTDNGFEYLTPYPRELCVL